MDLRAFILLYTQPKDHFENPNNFYFNVDVIGNFRDGRSAFLRFC